MPPLASILLFLLLNLVAEEGNSNPRHKDYDCGHALFETVKPCEVLAQSSRHAKHLGAETCNSTSVVESLRKHPCVHSPVPGLRE